MQRILALADSFPKTSETFVVGHVRGMGVRGWEVAVAADSINQARLEDAFGPSVPAVFSLDKLVRWYRRLGRLSLYFYLYKEFGAGWRSLFPPGTRRADLARSLALKKVVEQWRPDLIHAHFGPLGLIAAPVAKVVGLPLIVNFRGFDFTSFPVEHGWGVYNSLPENALLVGHTRFCEDTLRSNLNYSVEHVRRGVDRAVFQSDGRADVWPKTIKLVITGRMVFVKGAHLAIDAPILLRVLAPEHDFTLTIAGPGRELDNLRVRARFYGLDGNVNFTDDLRHGEVADVFRQHDMQLIPSLPSAAGWVENFCTVASEGMASGLCVVGAGIGGIPEALESGGVLVPAGSAFELARGIVYGIRKHSPSGWQRIAVAKADTYSDVFMFDDYEEVSQKALRGNYGR
jgi:colanic acid/amylovoran biosynthesis glycosyltransferase